MNREQLSQAIASTYPQKPPPTRGLYANMIWNFYHEIRPGDFVVARNGRKTLAAVGKVTVAAAYEPGRNPATTHPNFLGVVWDEKPRDKTFDTVVFPMQTVKDLTEVQFRSLVEGSLTAIINDAEETEETEETGETSNANEFVLEKYLEEFIVSNFSQIFKGELTVYKDPEGNEGQQYSTEIGPIDILAVESKTKTYVVIELKKGRPQNPCPLDLA